MRWWLGVGTSGRTVCPFCPDVALDPLGHHGSDIHVREMCWYGTITCVMW